MKRIIAYAVALIGLGVFSLSVKPVRESALISSIPGIASLSSNIFLIAGGVLVIAGVVLLRFSSKGGKQAPEVPIYQGKSVVGFRRMSKK